MANGIDEEGLKDVLAMMEEVAEKRKQIRDLTEEQKKDVSAMANLMLRSETELSRIANDRRKKALRFDEEGKDAKAEEMRQEQLLMDFIIKSRRSGTAEIKKQAAEVKNLGLDSVKTSKGAAEALKDNASKVAGAATSSYQASAGAISAIQEKQIEALAKMSGKTAEQAKSDGMTVQNAFGEAMMGGGAGTLIKKGLSWLGGEVIGIGTDLVADQATTMMTHTKRVITDLDSQYSAYRKRVGIDLPDAQKAFLGVMDDGAEMAQKWNSSNERLAHGLGIIADIYIDPSEASQALQSLTTGLSNFSVLAREEKDRPTATMIANNVAALSKLGIAQENTVKAMELGSKAMKMNEFDMVKLARQVTGVGIALDKDLNQVMGDFNAMAPELSQFGEKMVDVFAKLEAQSKATGIAAGDLLNTAMKFDTFEGAAQAAGRLNAILGDTVVDTMALIHADPDKKINMLRDSLDAAGKSFDTMHRREQQVIASTLGLSSVAEARKLLNQDNAAAYAEFVDKVDDGKGAFQATDKQIRDLAKSAGSITDILQGAASDMASTLIAATKVIRVAAEASYGTVSTVSDGVDFVIDKVKGHQDAVSASAVKHREATDSMRKDRAALNAEGEKMKGAEAVVIETKVKKTKKAAIETPAPKEPARKKTPSRTKVSSAAIRAMKRDVDALNTSFSKLPDSVDALAKSLNSLAKIDLENLNFTMPDLNVALSPIKAALDMSVELATVRQETVDQPPLVAELAALKGPGPAPKTDVLATPVSIVKDYREEIQRTQSLDRTNYIEKIVEVNKKQEETLQSNTQLIDQIQKLVTAVGEKAAVDAAEKFDITLEVGGDQFRTAVKKALGRI